MRLLAALGLLFGFSLLAGGLAALSVSAAPAPRNTQIIGKLEVTSDAIKVHMADESSVTLIFVERSDERKVVEWSGNRVRANGRAASARCRPYFVVESIVRERE